MSLPGFRTDARAVAILSLFGCAAAHADGLGPIRGAISETKPIFDTRLRFEDVDQDGITNEAEAGTVRMRLGFETGKAWETALLVEGDLLWQLDSDYNSTTNGRIDYPVVADPRTHEINRLQLSNTGIPMTAVTLGRQRIVLDDQRFVGNVGWRQNEQTFDAVRTVNKTLPNVTFDVAYVDQVNRVFGNDSPQGQYKGNIYLTNVAYQFPIGKLSGFGYWLDIDAIAGVPAAVRDSSETAGLRFAGERGFGKIKLAYAVSYAKQREYADNPQRFDNSYSMLELTGTYRQFNIGLGDEILEGDGVKGFTTPLATLHKFQGWADKFLVTPPNGVDDRYVSAGFTLKGVGAFDTVAVLSTYHEFEAQRGSSDYGSELDLQLQIKWHRFLVAIKYADYDADQYLTDTTKYWLQVDYVW